MNVDALMTEAAVTCHATESLQVAARLMWEADRGAIIVVDEAGKAVGVVTDRDICMCALTQGKSLEQIHVSTAASRHLLAVHPWDSIELAEAIMQTQRVRRLPVIDVSGKPIGMVTVNDLVREAAASGLHCSALTIEVVLKTISALDSPHEAGFGVHASAL